MYCTSLKSIAIPDSVTEIGKHAFLDCESLESVIIPDSVTKISDYAFEVCNNLTIHCNKGSYADTYAKKNDISVKYTDVKKKRYTIEKE
jgi:hypothetical protein